MTIAVSDALVDDIVRRAASTRIYSGPSHLEAHLVDAVRRAFREDGQAAPSVAEPRYELRGWTRSPGGVDLLASPCDGSGTVLMEMKVGKPDEGLWDAVKLADILTHTPSAVAAYLIYGGSSARWVAKTPVAALFLNPPACAAVRELIARWPAAWGDLLFGGKGIRPQTSTATLAFSLVGSHKARHHPGHQIKVLRVQPSGDDRETYDADGWPTGYEPPEGLRAKVLASEERRRLRMLEGSSPADERDPCHGYPWYAKWTQSRLIAVVPWLDPPAYACLRNRLHRERKWREDELRARVDPLRAA
jgi:hypothetical protein